VQANDVVDARLYKKQYKMGIEAIEDAYFVETSSWLSGKCLLKYSGRTSYNGHVAHHGKT
jgi:hypothetical protein